MFLAQYHCNEAAHTTEAKSHAIGGSGVELGYSDLSRGLVEAADSRQVILHTALCSGSLGGGRRGRGEGGVMGRGKREGEREEGGRREGESEEGGGEGGERGRVGGRKVKQWTMHHKLLPLTAAQSSPATAVPTLSPLPPASGGGGARTSVV